MTRRCVDDGPAAVAVELVSTGVGPRWTVEGGPAAVAVELVSTGVGAGRDEPDRYRPGLESKDLVIEVDRDRVVPAEPALDLIDVGVYWEKSEAAPVERLEQRVERIEGQVDSLTDSLRERLERLEKSLPPPPPPRSARLWSLAEKAVIPVLLLVLGFVLKDSVDQALRRRQLQLSAASEIQGLVEKMASGGREEARTAAVTLASYGDFAAIALARELQEVDSVGSLAAEDGLRSLALAGSDAACSVLQRMVENRTRLYDWRTHRRAIRLLGELECRSARRRLEEIRELIGSGGAAGLTAYGELVKTEIDRDDLRQLAATVDEALANLDRGRR